MFTQEDGTVGVLDAPEKELNLEPRFDEYGGEPEIPEQQIPETFVHDEAPEPPAKLEMTQEQMLEMVRSLEAKLAELNKAPKNHVAGKPGNKVYMRLGTLKTWGKVPQQQADLAAILTAGMELDKEYSEADVFKMVTEEAVKFPSLAGSKQDPTYLFRYYRGLKPTATHAGFIGRDFLRVR